jgi:hypothetical protein
MSHTLTMIDDLGREWAAIHNGDWSGDVKLRLRPCLDEPEGVEFVVPGSIIRAAAVALFKSDLIGLLEGWDGSGDAIRAARVAMLRHATVPR